VCKVKRRREGGRKGGKREIEGGERGRRETETGRGVREREVIRVE
jgi:hypothetical protein